MKSSHAPQNAVGRAVDATGDRVLALIMRGGRVVWSDDIRRQIEAQFDDLCPLATRQRAFEEVFRIAMYLDRRFGSVPACDGLCDLLERHLDRIQTETERAHALAARRSKGSTTCHPGSMQTQESEKSSQKS